LVFLSSRVVDELINDGRVLDRVKVELYVPVALGLRRCAVIELPASLPDGLQLARKVNEACRGDYELVIREQDPVRKWPLIVALKNNLQKGFEEEVMNSESYVALTYWEKKLRLRRHMIVLRPTIREVYIYRDMDRWWTIRRLAQQRLRLRRDAIRDPRYRDIAAFPEEFAPEYLRDTGRLLGYPSCCVEAYIRDRAAGTVAEIRLSRQLQSLPDRERTLSMYSFFTKDFYPCRPECPEAEKTGRRFFEALGNLDQRLGQLYLKCLQQNRDFVENYGTHVAMHVAEVDRSLSDSWIAAFEKADPGTQA